MILFACNNVQIIGVLSSANIDSQIFIKIIPYLVRFVSTWYSMTIAFMVLERLILINKCFHFDYKRFLKNKKAKATLLLITLSIIVNIILTLFVQSILPVTLSFTALTILLYIILLFRISSLMKQSCIAKQLLKGTARNYITVMLVVYATFSITRDVAVAFFFKARVRLLKKTTKDCMEPETWMIALLLLHSLHWVIDPIVYFFYHRAPRQTFRKLLHVAHEKLHDMKTQIDILIIVYCPCDCPITFRKRQVTIHPAETFCHINKISISDNENRGTILPEWPHQGEM